MFFSERTGLQKLLLLKAAAGGSVVEDTATGNPLTFLTDLAKPLKSLLIPFTPIQQGTGDPSPVNIRPIVPWEGLTVFGGGENLFDASAVIRRDGYMLNEQGQEITSNTSGYIQNITPVKPSTQYTFSGIVSHNGYLWRIYFYDKNGSFVSKTDAIEGFTEGNTFTFTTPSNCYGISFQYTKAFIDSSTFMLEVGQTATAYEPYVPITETDISFPSPVYGGTLDAVSGVLTVEWSRYDLGQLSWELKSNGNNHWFYSGDVPELKIISDSGILSSIMCERYKTVLGAYIYNGSAGDNVVGQDGDVPRIRIRDDSYNNDADAFKTAMSGVYLYFELATPQEIQLTPQQITALVGNNTIWSDADGSMTAIYLKKA